MKLGIPGRSGSDTMPGLQIRLLGVPQVLLDGAPITELKSSKGKALLFYLAVTGQTYTRASLAALLWGDVSEQAARTNLRKALQNRCLMLQSLSVKFIPFLSLGRVLIYSNYRPFSQLSRLEVAPCLNPLVHQFRPL